MVTTPYPRTADDAIRRLYDAATAYEAETLDYLLRRAGLRWEHIGCWTNSVRSRTCGRCGRRRSTLERDGEVIAS